MLQLIELDFGVGLVKHRFEIVFRFYKEYWVRRENQDQGLVEQGCWTLLELLLAH